MIFKVQVNMAADRVLAYNKSNSEVIELSGKAAIKLIKSNNWAPMSRHFYEAAIEKDKLVLMKKVGDRKW